MRAFNITLTGLTYDSFVGRSCMHKQFSTTVNLVLFVLFILSLRSSSYAGSAPTHRLAQASIVALCSIRSAVGDHNALNAYPDHEIFGCTDHPRQPEHDYCDCVLDT